MIRRSGRQRARAVLSGVAIFALVLGACSGKTISIDPAATGGGVGTGGTSAGTGGAAPNAGAAGGSVATGGKSFGSAGSSAGKSGSGNLPASVPLTPMYGWVDGSGNVLGIQGALFGFADSTTAMDLVGYFTETSACISGTAAKVDLLCTPVPPATDCYGTFWGAAIGFNLNQPIDSATMMGVNTPLPYDASALVGFAFELSGDMVPTSLRFTVDTPTGSYCSPPTVPITAGANTVLFSDLRTECWTVGGASGEAAKPAVVKISWQVVTNSNTPIPFDFCVSNLQALL